MDSRHGRKTEKQRIDILDLLNPNSIIPSITNRASIGSMKYSREKEWQKGENGKVYSKEIEMVSTIRDCFIVDRLGFGNYHFDSRADDLMIETEVKDVTKLEEVVCTV